jgi:hypothetical protein
MALTTDLLSTMRSLCYPLGFKKMRQNISAPSSTLLKKRSQLKKKLSKLTTLVLPKRLKRPKTVKTKDYLKPWLKSEQKLLSLLTRTSMKLLKCVKFKNYIRRRRQSTRKRSPMLLTRPSRVLEISSLDVTSKW